jgi:BTB/POZ domain-containing protein KCTD9
METRKRRCTDDFRENIDSWKRTFKEISTSSEYELIRVGLFLFLGVFIVLVFLNWGFGGADWAGILTEAHGMLMDIFIFGVLLTWFERVGSRKNQIKSYHDQLNDFRSWASEEGVLRKVGILQRLNEMGATLPDLSHFNFSKAMFIKPNFKGVNLYNADLTDTRLEKANLEGANLLGAEMERAWLREATLKDTNLELANLKDAVLTKSNLIGAKLEGTNLTGADLRKADLRKADLNVANLIGANFKEADLKGANLDMADLKGTDLKWVKNLTINQIQYAVTDSDTVLPDYLLKEVRKNKEPEI